MGTKDQSKAKCILCDTLCTSNKSSVHFSLRATLRRKASKQEVLRNRTYSSVSHELVPPSVSLSLSASGKLLLSNSCWTIPENSATETVSAIKVNVYKCIERQKCTLVKACFWHTTGVQPAETGQRFVPAACISTATYLHGRTWQHRVPQLIAISTSAIWRGAWWWTSQCPCLLCIKCIEQCQTLCGLLCFTCALPVLHSRLWKHGQACKFFSASA